MFGLILAAGKGTRMGNIGKPKCLLRMGDTSIIEFQVEFLKKVGIHDILVITGYQSEKIKNVLKNGVKFLNNPKFSETNNLHSMWVARKILQDDFICIYSDLMFHPEILSRCYNSKSDACLMVETNTREETMKVKTQSGKIIAVSDDIPNDQVNGNFIGMAKFSKPLAKILFNEISVLVRENNTDAYYTLAIEKMIEQGIKIGYSTTNNFPWFNINDQNEFKKSEKIFKNFGGKK